MSQPTPYTRTYDFVALRASGPGGIFPANLVEVELNNIKTTTDQIITNLALIQRDDGSLRTTLTEDDLSEALLNAYRISSGDLDATYEEMLDALIVLTVVNADVTTVSNLELDNFKSGVVDTDNNLAAASALKIAPQSAVKAYADAINTALQTSITAINDTAAFKAAANAFTAAQSITVTAGGQMLRLASTDAAPQLHLVRATNTVTASVMDLRSSGLNASSTEVDYSAVSTIIETNTAGAEDARLSLSARRAGSLTGEQWRLGAGFYHNTLTAPGVGKVNATEYQLNNVVLLNTDGTLAGNSTGQAPSVSAVKTYVDTLVLSTAPHLAVACATTANITLSGEQTLDGVLTSASRVLVKEQTAPAENGIYVSAAGAWARATDMNLAPEAAGLVPVTGGSTLANTVWLSTTPTAVIGTDPIVFTIFNSGAGNTYAAGAGILLTGNTFSLNRTVATAGLATGGGALTADRTITVTEATSGNLAESTTVLTPRRVPAANTAWAVSGINAAATAAPTVEALGFIGGQGAYKATQNFSTITSAVVDVIDYTRPLNYDAQTANFTNGQDVTGGTSGATARIRTQSDLGTTGTLNLHNIVGTFQDNETITDGLGGSATVNGTIGAKAYDSTINADTRFETHAAFAAVRGGAGYTYENTSSVGKTDLAGYFQSARQNYLDDVQKGQVIATFHHAHIPRNTDGGAIVWLANKAYVAGGLGISPIPGATSGIEGNIVLRDADNLVLLELGAMVGSVPAQENTGIHWVKQGLAFRAQLGSDSNTTRGDSDTVKAYSAFLCEDGIAADCAGFWNIMSAHQTSASAPYFYITGHRFKTNGVMTEEGAGAARGLVRAQAGTQSAPTYGFVANPTTGYYLDAVNTLGFTAGGTKRASISTTLFTTTLPLTILSGTAPPATGLAGVGLLMGSTAGFGIYFGTDVPNFTAANGSLYLRNGVATINTRMYINNGGGTTWTPVLTAA